MKFKIQQELGAKPETRKAAKEGSYTLGLTEWLVRTLLSVSARRNTLAVFEATSGVRLQVSFGDETAKIFLWQIVEEDC